MSTGFADPSLICPISGKLHEYDDSNKPKLCLDCNWPFDKSPESDG